MTDLTTIYSLASSLLSAKILNVMPVYKSVFNSCFDEEPCLKLKESVQAYLIGALNDPRLNLAFVNLNLAFSS